MISIVEWLISAIVGLLAFVVFYLLLKRYYLARLWKSIGVYAIYKIITIVLTLASLLSLRTVVQNYQIEGYAMAPTLQQDQFLIGDKLVYRWLHPPERGDIIVFEYPRAPDRDFIERVIGLPGEKIEVRQGRVYINDQPLEEPYIVSPPSYPWGPRVAGKDEYFVLGDNRNNSSDSHVWGFLPRKNIIGKASFSYWPPEHWGIIQTPRYSAASN
jgi:signal peptidase I